ncbi:aminotransferase [Demequina capsici]|uniref:Aminotransferase n=1 Tax=Demequina capsici TaxID=3075620 RepID=A0AA96F9V0_9MICO|nr:aminotransferase [Demequina sp. PMTSA13]WNM26448.1 aminotransferase [Demequina sp. PMTSA13]
MGDTHFAAWNEATAARIARDMFGIDVASVRLLGSNEDLNARIEMADSVPLVLKVTHPGISRDALEAQVAAADHLTAAGLGLVVPRTHPTVQGDPIGAVEWSDGTRLVRLLDFVPGGSPTEAARPPAGAADRLGAAAGALTAALTGFTHPGLLGGGDWDLREAGRIVAASRLHLDPDVVTQVDLAMRLAEERLGPLRDTLRVQATHGDLTGDNLLCDASGAIVGVIDFGDLGLGWVAAEAAVTASSLLQHDGDALALAFDAIAAFDARLPLTEPEIAALWPAILMRAAVLVASAGRVLAADPSNEYAAARMPLERRILARALELELDEAEALLRHALGRVPALPSVLGLMVDGLADAPCLDLTVTSQVHDSGSWTDPDASVQALLALARASGSAVTAYGERRLTASAAAGDPPRSLALGIDLAVPVGTRVVAPAAGTVAVGEVLTLAFDEGGAVLVHGTSASVTHGERVVAGQELGVAVRPDDMAVLHVQLAACASLTPPPLARPAQERAWRELCPDPSSLIGRTSVAVQDADADRLARRRDDVVARVQEHYYAQPPRIERGWRHHLIDVDGRAYLDMVNNVAILGHGEPRLAHAVDAQMRRLNTNSRFHYGAIVELSERLASLAPDGLDTVMLVNSGSEAVDLALRIVRAVTGREDVLALTEAYHGWTVGADAVSTSLGDNPRALDTRPSWVHLLDAPNTYRGTHRGDDAHRYLPDALDRIAALDDAGVSLAGFIAEPLFGNGGGIALPDGYLAGVWAAIRARGGLCISDEVQVSYGRLGHHFWGFEQQGAVPDVITVAKAMGNGHPLGAVITSREVADAFAVEGSFFSSAGGSPVSCVVGTAVLDILESDGLQDNARVVGDRLADGLRALAGAHPALGAVHGMGLYLGVEVVAGGPDAPDPAGAREICDALLDQGVIVQPTGDHKNVLKIKPPMTIDEAAVDRFLAALDRVLTWREARRAL